MTDPAPGADPDVERALLEVTRALTALSLDAADRLGEMSLAQLRVLRLLAGAGSVGLTELALQLHVSAPTVGRLVDRLVGADVVSRRIVPDSLRKVELRLTEHGRQTLAHYDRLRLEELRARLATLPEPRRRQFLELLPALTGALREREPGPA